MINHGTDTNGKTLFEADARTAIRKTARKLRIGRAYRLPLHYVSMRESYIQYDKCVCTGKYPFFATFSSSKGVPMSFSYYELISRVK